MRIVVVGGPGAGKSTLARVVAGVLDAPHVELDALYWGPNWEPVNAGTFRRSLLQVAERPRWVADGNYLSAGSREILWPKADRLVWLDFPAWLTVTRLVRRTAWRAATRRRLWSIELREPLRHLFRPDVIVRWALGEHARFRHRMLIEIERDNLRGSGRLVELRGPQDVRKWMATLPSPEATGAKQWFEH